MNRPAIYVDLFHGHAQDFNVDGLIPGALYGRARQYIRQLTEDEAEHLPDPRTLPAEVPKKRHSNEDTRTIETREARYWISQTGCISRLAPDVRPCECVTRCADPIGCRAAYFCRMCKKWRIATAGGCKCDGFSELAPWRRDPLTGERLSDWREDAAELRNAGEPADPTSENSEN